MFIYFPSSEYSSSFTFSIVVVVGVGIVFFVVIAALVVFVLTTVGATGTYLKVPSTALYSFLNFVEALDVATLLAAPSLGVSYVVTLATGTFFLLGDYGLFFSISISSAFYFADDDFSWNSFILSTDFCKNASTPKNPKRVFAGAGKNLKPSYINVKNMSFAAFNTL